MQAEMMKAEGVQHQQAQTPTLTPLPDDHPPTTEGPAAKAVPEGLERLHAAIHGELGPGHMTWMK
ncbi:MAG: hypothetical protein EON60_01430 [Alphaproteobacteria bacterium]|nr:MAG: hypothetical protein EON60_01430 [Alphaproteobacteria bacterium]